MRGVGRLTWLLAVASCLGCLGLSQCFPTRGDEWGSPTCAEERTHCAAPEEALALGLSEEVGGLPSGPRGARGARCIAPGAYRQRSVLQRSMLADYRRHPNARDFFAAQEGNPDTARAAADDDEQPTPAAQPEGLADDVNAANDAAQIVPPADDVTQAIDAAEVRALEEIAE